MKKKFRLSDTIDELTNQEKTYKIQFHLWRLLAWAFLPPGEGNRKNLRRSKYAVVVGRMFLAKRCEKALARIAEPPFTLSDNDQKRIALFQAHGGLTQLMNHKPAYLLMGTALSEADWSLLAYSTVKQLIEIQREEGKRVLINVAHERIRSGENPDRLVIQSEQSMSQGWEKYAAGAAVIYAAYEYWPLLRHHGQLGTFQKRLYSKDEIDEAAEKKLKKEIRTICRLVRDLSADRAELNRFLWLIGRGAVALAKLPRTKAISKRFIHLADPQPEKHVKPNVCAD